MVSAFGNIRFPSEGGYVFVIEHDGDRIGPPRIPSAGGTVTSDRVLTIPNVISVIRIAGILYFCGCCWQRMTQLPPAWALGAIGTTDWG